MTKAGGVPYEELELAHMVVVDLEGRTVEGRFRCSSDPPTHLARYRAWEDIGGIVHTHARYATAFAQAGRGIPCYGTPHADAFCGEIPCTRAMTEPAIRSEDERNAATPIMEAFAGRGRREIPAALGEAARTALSSRLLNSGMQSLCQEMLDRHCLRKHGTGAYDRQEKKGEER